MKRKEKLAMVCWPPLCVSTRPHSHSLYIKPHLGSALLYSIKSLQQGEEDSKHETARVHEDLFERIAQDTVVKIDLPKYIEKYLHYLLDGDKERALLKIRNPPSSKDAPPLFLWMSEVCRHFIFYYYYGGLQTRGDEKTWSNQTIYRILDLFSMFFGELVSEASYGEIINEAHKDRIYNINLVGIVSSRRRDKNDAGVYQEQNATTIYEQSFGPKKFDERHYLEDTKLAKNGVDDLNFHFIQYSNSSINTAKKFKSISIHGHSRVVVALLAYKNSNVGLYLEKLLKERKSVKAKLCEENAIAENGRNCVSISDNTPRKTSFDDTFAVNIADKNAINVNIKDLKISDLKFLIWNKKKDTLGINDPDFMTLWKSIFLSLPLVDENIYIIVQVPAAEIPRILREKFADDLDLGPRLKDDYIYNHLGNGTKMNLRYEPNVNVAIAKRMFYQCQDSNLTWNEVRDLMPSFTITEILKKCAKYKRMSFKDMTVILIIDGMQNALINDNNGRDKIQHFILFYGITYCCHEQ
ncbi:hypothetical protein RhiirA4_546098 [Rhizophagus irregularis]|uniref:Crinkler family protein n=1 Tax=Rhizophagus irregularis TaxID=588596 RepID=A0A2I1GVK8_9GLOM|nr:hypothetical protein RhiirA4_546098 [Rhizophagus irregularis]